MNPLFIALLPEIPRLLSGIVSLWQIATKPDATQEEVNAQLNVLSAQLKGTMAKVAAVELPNPSPS